MVRMVRLTRWKDEMDKGVYWYNSQIEWIVERGVVVAMREVSAACDF